MKRIIGLLQSMGMFRPKSADDTDKKSIFEHRLKKVNRARLVNQVGLGGPVFKSRQSETDVYYEPVDAVPLSGAAVADRQRDARREPD